MINIKSVNVGITEEATYSTRREETPATPPDFNLNVAIKSNSREFLERVSAAVHAELANPEPHSSKTDLVDKFFGVSHVQREARCSFDRAKRMLEAENGNVDRAVWRIMNGGKEFKEEDSGA